MYRKLSIFWIFVIILFVQILFVLCLGRRESDSHSAEHDHRNSEEIDNHHSPPRSQPQYVPKFSRYTPFLTEESLPSPYYYGAGFRPSADRSHESRPNNAPVSRIGPQNTRSRSVEESREESDDGPHRMGPPDSRSVEENRDENDRDRNRRPNNQITTTTDRSDQSNFKSDTSPRYDGEWVKPVNSTEGIRYLPTMRMVTDTSTEMSLQSLKPTLNPHGFIDITDEIRPGILVQKSNGGKDHFREKDKSVDMNSRVIENSFPFPMNFTNLDLKALDLKEFKKMNKNESTGVKLFADTRSNVTLEVTCIPKIIIANETFVEPSMPTKTASEWPTPTTPANQTPNSNRSRYLQLMLKPNVPYKKGQWSDRFRSRFGTNLTTTQMPPSTNTIYNRWQQNEGEQEAGTAYKMFSPLDGPFPEGNRDDTSPTTSSTTIRIGNDQFVLRNGNPVNMRQRVLHRPLYRSDGGNEADEEDHQVREDNNPKLKPPQEAHHHGHESEHNPNTNNRKQSQTSQKQSPLAGNFGPPPFIRQNYPNYTNFFPQSSRQESPPENRYKFPMEFRPTFGHRGESPDSRVLE